MGQREVEQMFSTREHLVGVTEAREKLKELLDELPERDVVILRHNRPVALLVAPARVEKLMSAIEDLEDEVAVLRSKAFPEATVSHEQVKRELGLGEEAREPAAATG